MEEKFREICQYIDNGDKDGMLEYIKTHNIQPQDYQDDFCYDYPIDRAATFGNIAIFNALIELGYSIEGVEIHPILQATIDGYLDFVRALVEVHGVDPSTTDPYGCTAMMCAINEMHLDIVKYLISAGISVNERIPEDDRFHKDITILHYAAANESCDDICEYLISVGADIEAQDTEGNTPLHIAAAELNTNIIQILLEAKAFVDARNSSGETSFLVALSAFCKNPWNGNSAAKALYKEGADPKARDSSGKSALNYATCSYNQAYFLLVEVNLTASSVSDVREMFRLALKAQNKHTLNLLVNLGYDPWHLDGVYDVSESSWEEGQEVVKSLLDVSTQPRNLADLCCFKIRNILGVRLPKVLECLPVVKKVEEFVRLSHIPRKMEYENEDDEEDEDEYDDDSGDDEH